MWNFFRLENEHLNNVGHFRVVSDVPLPYDSSRVASLRGSQSMAALVSAAPLEEEIAAAAAETADSVLVRIHPCPDTAHPLQPKAWAEQRTLRERAQDRLEYTRTPVAERDHEADDNEQPDRDEEPLPADGLELAVRFEDREPGKEAGVRSPHTAGRRSPASTMSLRSRRSQHRQAPRQTLNADYETEEPAPDRPDTRKQFRELDLPFKGERHSDGGHDSTDK